MIDNDILYCLKSLSHTELFYSNNRKVKIDKNFIELINEELLNDLTTLKGRKEAIRKKYGFVKNPPLYLTEFIVFITIKVDEVSYFINAKMIQDLIKTKDKDVIVLFKDGTNLKLNKSKRFVKNYLDKALTIQK